MALHWGSAPLTACLPTDLLTRLHEAYANPTASLDTITGPPTFNGQTGELLLEMAGDLPQRVSRRKLRALFAESILVSYGKAFVSG